MINKCIVFGALLDIRRRECAATLFVTHDILSRYHARHFITHHMDEAMFLSDRIFVMTARPRCLKLDAEKLRFLLPSARSVMRLFEHSPEFYRLHAEIYTLLTAERQASLGTP